MDSVSTNGFSLAFLLLVHICMLLMGFSDINSRNIANKNVRETATRAFSLPDKLVDDKLVDDRTHGIDY